MRALKISNLKLPRRRARLSTGVQVNDFVSGRVLTDFGNGSVTLRDAYLRLDFSPALRVTMGQFKRPFDPFELESASQILVIERAGDIRGVSRCTGVGGVCSLSRLTKRLEFSARDIGVMATGTAGLLVGSLPTTRSSVCFSGPLFTIVQCRGRVGARRGVHRSERCRRHRR